jgi:hypothetical protein
MGHPVAVFEELEFEERSAEVKWYSQQLVIPLFQFPPYPKFPSFLKWLLTFGWAGRHEMKLWEIECERVKTQNLANIQNVRRSMIAQLIEVTKCPEECVTVLVEPDISESYPEFVRVRGKAPCYTWIKND